MFDVIVVGARCAGAPLSMLLSRRGYRVLLVDKSKFPSDTTSTHLIWQTGLARAKRWGLADKIAGLGAPPIHTCRLDTGELEFGGSPPPLDGIDYAVAPRRTVLDKLLVDAAVDAGAELREQFYAGEILIEGRRVTGIRGRIQGRDVVEKARFVVGADGAHSLLALTVKAPKYNVQPSGSCAYYSYWRGGPRISDFEVYVRAGWGGAAFPTNDGLTCIVSAWADSFTGPNKRREDAYRKFMMGVPRMAEILNQGEQVEPLAGIREFPGYFRQAWGDGWALAGDAGYHKHPISAQGISDAFRDADLLSEAINDGFSGRRELPEALAGYEQKRNEAVMAMYASTCARALLEPPAPEQMSLFRALQHNQREADRFFGTDAGTVPMAEFFSPENLDRIMRQGRASGVARA